MHRQDIEAARKAGILDTVKAAELEAFLKSKGDPGASMDGENLRFLANFNDVFISIGIVLLAIGISVGSGIFLGGTGNAFIIFLPVIAALWALLEYFAGRRRLLLPSMTLSVMIVGVCMTLFAIAATGLQSQESATTTFLDRGFTVAIDFSFWATVGAVIASGAIYARFRLPFALFLIAVSAALGVYNWALTSGEVARIFSGVMSFSVGLATLGAAIVFDSRDPDRKSLASDNAFWLHFAAAPQIMFGLRALLLGGTFADTTSISAGDAALLLAALLAFAILSLALNRRALIAAALISFWLALGTLVDAAGGSEVSSTVWTLLLLGGGIVLIGAGWKTARRMVLAFAPKTGIFGRIFPPEPA